MCEYLCVFVRMDMPSDSIDPGVRLETVVWPSISIQLDVFHYIANWTEITNVAIHSSDPLAYLLVLFTHMLHLLVTASYACSPTLNRLPARSIAHSPLESRETGI